MAGRSIERRVHELEVPHTRVVRQLCHFVDDVLGIAQAIPPTLDVEIRAVNALEHAAALGLYRHRAAAPLVPGEIEPAMHARRGEGIHVRIAAGRRTRRWPSGRGTPRRECRPGRVPRRAHREAPWSPARRRRPRRTPRLTRRTTTPVRRRTPRRRRSRARRAPRRAACATRRSPRACSARAR